MSRRSNAITERGETAVLGLVHSLTPLHPHPDPIASTSSASDSAVPHQAHASSSKTVRGVGRRKQLRKDNARLASNPHVVRPNVRDYSLKHNERLPSFPLPPDLQREFFRRSDSRTVQAPDRSAEFGSFTMGLSDANWFLQHRVGVRPYVYGEHVEEGVDLSAIQAYTKQVQTQIDKWLRQDVFLHTSSPSKSPVALIVPSRTELDDHQQVHSRTLFEISRNDQNLVWSVGDPFLRLVVHCVARVYGCASFSKDASDTVRQTWILRARRPRHRAVEQPQPGMLPTPPPTDIGTDGTASDTASLMDIRSEYAISDVGEADEEGQDSGWMADTTVRGHVREVGRDAGQDVLEEDEAELADVE